MIPSGLQHGEMSMKVAIRMFFRILACTLTVLSVGACQTNDPYGPYRETYPAGAAYPYPVVPAYPYPAGGYVIVPEHRENIRERIEHSQHNIDRASAKGRLTESEAQGLKQELDGIVGKVDGMQGDGHLNYREREQIHHDLDRLQKNIRREKRDEERCKK